jgi:hypothetical protein
MKQHIVVKMKLNTPKQRDLSFFHVAIGHPILEETTMRDNPLHQCSLGRALPNATTGGQYRCYHR